MAMTGTTASRPSLTLPSAIQATSFLIGGEAAITGDDGMPDFRGQHGMGGLQHTAPASGWGRSRAGAPAAVVTLPRSSW